MVLAEQAKIIPIIYPWGSNAATKDSDVFSMKNASHATIILTVGVQAGSFTAILYECDNFTPSNATAIAARIYKEETADSDTLADGVALAATGVATAATSNIHYVIEVDAEDLTEGYPNLQLRLSDLDNTTYVSAVAILTGYAYQGKSQPTEIA
jgi:hypothetical protein